MKNKYLVLDKNNNPVSFYGKFTLYIDAITRDWRMAGEDKPVPVVLNRHHTDVIDVWEYFALRKLNNTKYQNVAAEHIKRAREIIKYLSDGEHYFPVVCNWEGTPHKAGDVVHQIDDYLIDNYKQREMYDDRDESQVGLALTYEELTGYKKGFEKLINSIQEFEAIVGKIDAMLGAAGIDENIAVMLNSEREFTYDNLKTYLIARVRKNSYADIFVLESKIVNGKWDTMSDTVTLDFETNWNKNIELLANFKIDDLASATGLWYTGIPIADDKDLYRKTIKINKLDMQFNLKAMGQSNKMIVALKNGQISDFFSGYSFDKKTISDLKMAIEKKRLETAIEVLPKNSPTLKV